ncbi:hypothetical protein RCIA194 [Methanocella arvoryzae MRE50]|uniref:Uncharacterized protein n=1 Tax=Methanocella arvoryzae (strain DSM 22066 / NBRC 105507 / MRE50) TaxID=351160 RepID=Q0W1P8_METAR|nr:hypothetical protein RCIA194 [Methanocella arvoryzae MRE50]
MASLAPWRPWRYFRLTQGQLSIFHSLYLNIPFLIRRVLGLLASLAALQAGKLRTASISSLMPDQGSDHHLTLCVFAI